MAEHMPEPESPPQILEVARIVITRELVEGQDLVGIHVDPSVTTFEALGMLELAKDYFLRDRHFGEEEDDDDDCYF